jgi:hypothetical protein
MRFKQEQTSLLLQNRFGSTPTLKLLFSSILCWFSLFAAHAQIMETVPLDYYNFEPIFKQDYIIKNKIKTITSAIVFKRDNHEIEDKGLRKCWEYDSTGLLKRYYVTSIRGFVNKEVQHPGIYRRGRRISPPYVTEEPVYNYDTTFIQFVYDKKKNPIIRRTQDGDYYNTFYYEYDSIGNLRKQSHFKETNASESKYEFRLGVQNLVSVEEFTTQKLSPTQFKRKHLNDEGKVYKETILNYDSLGRLKEENNSFTVSWMRASTKLRYDSVGLVAQRIYTSNENGDELSKSEFKYTPDRLLDIEKRYKGDILYYELNFIYDRQTKQLSSSFVREFLTKSFVISRYAYQYY